METLVTLGQTLGLAGVGAGIFFLLFREIVQKNIFPQMDKERGYRLLKSVMFYVFIFSLVVVILATVVQLLRGGSLFANLDFRSGDTSGSFRISFQSFESIFAARAAELDISKQKSGARIGMNIGESYQRYNQAAASISKTLATLRSASPYRERISERDVRAADLGIQRNETATLSKLLDAIIAAAGNERRTDTRRAIAEIGYLTGQLQELGLQFGVAEQTYLQVISFSATHLSSTRALATLLAERGEFRAGMKIAGSLVTSIKTNTPADKLLLSRAFALLAEMKLWSGDFTAALQDLKQADDAAVQVEGMPEFEFKMETAARLNTAAGLYVNMGEINRATQLIRASIEAYAQANGGPSLLNSRINLGAILIEGGQLKEAGEVAHEVEASLDMLANGDFMRGYFFLLKANLYIRQRNAEAAQSNLVGAREFFSTMDSGGRRIGFRVARLRCLEVRLYYIGGQWSDVTKSSDDCLAWMPATSFARLADLIEVRYLKWKSDAILSQTQAAWPQNDLDFGNLPPLPPALAERVRLMESVAKAVRLFERDKGEALASLTQAILGLVTFEHKTGRSEEHMAEFQ